MSRAFSVPPIINLQRDKLVPYRLEGYTAENRCQWLPVSYNADTQCGSYYFQLLPGAVTVPHVHPGYIKRVVVATYQSVSGAGKAGIDELWDQTKAIYNPVDEVKPTKFSKQIAFNVIPHIDVFLDDGSTKEEWKMVAETKKILDPAIKVTATCVRVPVFVGHSEAINIEFEDSLDWQEAQDILREAPGVMLVDKREAGGYVTPVECVGDYATFITRIREAQTIDKGLNMWVVSENLRKGAALNNGIAFSNQRRKTNYNKMNF